MKDIIGGVPGFKNAMNGEFKKFEKFLQNEGISMANIPVLGKIAEILGLCAGTDGGLLERMTHADQAGYTINAAFDRMRGVSKRYTSSYAEKNKEEDKCFLAVISYIFPVAYVALYSFTIPASLILPLLMVASCASKVYVSIIQKCDNDDLLFSLEKSEKYLNDQLGDGVFASIAKGVALSAIIQIDIFAAVINEIIDYPLFVGCTITGLVCEACKEIKASVEGFIKRTVRDAVQDAVQVGALIN